MSNVYGPQSLPIQNTNSQIRHFYVIFKLIYASYLIMSYSISCILTKITVRCACVHHITNST